MDTSSTNGIDELVILHDDEGNDYLIRSSILKEAQVPSNLKSKVSDIFRSETSGYDMALYALLKNYFGTSKKDAEWGKVSQYDYNHNGIIDYEDLQKALNA